MARPYADLRWPVCIRTGSRNPRGQTSHPYDPPHTSPEPQHRAHLPSVRQHLSEHLAIHEALVKGFRGFVCAHLALLLEAVGVRGLQGATPGPDAMDSEGGEGAAAGRVSAAQLDRLGFLIAQGPPSQEVWGLGEASPTRGSPMDICATPTLFQGGFVLLAWVLSGGVIVDGGWGGG